jgi:hypothetical protein
MPTVILNTKLVNGYFKCEIKFTHQFIGKGTEGEVRLQHDSDNYHAKVKERQLCGAKSNPLLPHKINGAVTQVNMAVSSCNTRLNFVINFEFVEMLVISYFDNIIHV